MAEIQTVPFLFTSLLVFSTVVSPLLSLAPSLSPLWCAYWTWSHAKLALPRAVSSADTLLPWRETQAGRTSVKKRETEGKIKTKTYPDRSKNILNLSLRWNVDRNVQWSLIQSRFEWFQQIACGIGYCSKKVQKNSGWRGHSGFRHVE